MPHANLLLSEFALNVPVRVERDGMSLVVIRLEGQIVAYEDVCPHAYWPLSEGSVRDGVLECPGHGWEFNAESGRCLNAPSYCLTKISTVVDCEMIRLEWEAKPETARSLPCG
jgi:nitrite reductase/ring-hydroxylating ferredoxin subunit